MRLRVHIEDKKIPARSFIFWTLSFAVTAVFFVAYPFLTAPADKNLPEFASSYSATPRSCETNERGDTVIKFNFSGNEPANRHAPTHNAKEFYDQGKSVVTFHNITEISGDFSYNDVISNQLVNSLDYSLSGTDLVVSISRKNAYLPVLVETHGATAKITLPAGNSDFPRIYNQSPADNSAVFPAPRIISFDAIMASPLKFASVLFQGEQAQLIIAKNATDSYTLSFQGSIENGKEYAVKAVITDDLGRATVNNWTFIGQIPVETALGKNRFKYLGWWGEINSDGIALRASASSTAEKIGTLSSANRVKIIKEVYGEWVDGKNLWYVIDGGAHAGAYIFSDYVTPMKQPEPPVKLEIPEEVKLGEKWIDVDLTKKVMTLFDYDKPVFATYISPGREGNETQTGTYRVWYKLYKTDMKGGPPLHSYRYHLKNIPWAMFYNHDYAIHGTYWHDKFGTPQSAGCTNMTQGDAKYIFENTLPIIPEGKLSVFSSDANPGTVVHNHE